jgi:capsid protein
MVANKPKAKVYELALQYTQHAKNNLIGSIQHPKVSEQAITNRINYKVDSLVKNNNTTKLKNQIDELLEKNKNIQEQINKLNTNVLSQKQTIQDLTLKINLISQINF